MEKNKKLENIEESYSEQGPNDNLILVEVESRWDRIGGGSSLAAYQIFTLCEIVFFRQNSTSPNQEMY